jgi:hypothetical protein
MQSLLGSGNDYVLLIAVLRRDPAQIKVLANLHIPAPASDEVLVGVCEVIGALARGARRRPKAGPPVARRVVHPNALSCRPQDLRRPKATAS